MNSTHQGQVIPLGNYSIVYAGGELADIVIDGEVTAYVFVRQYDSETGAYGPEPRRAELVDRVAQYIDDAGGIQNIRNAR